jgi:hypothetical protein
MEDGAGGGGAEGGVGETSEEPRTSWGLGPSWWELSCPHGPEGVGERAGKGGSGSA